MKTRSTVKLLTTVVLSLWLINGCAEQTTKPSASASSPETMAAIDSANKAIARAKANDWIWRDTGKILGQAKKAADAGDNTTAIKLANKARAQAEHAVAQYNYEKAHPRGL